MAPGLWLPPQRARHEAVSSGRTNLRRIFPIFDDEIVTGVNPENAEEIFREKVMKELQ